MSKTNNTGVKLDDLMVAMDVVDTLRHRDELVKRELDTEGRRARLIKKLREIYTAQGINVTDHLLEEGVRSLEEDRFVYEPPRKTFMVRLAHSLFQTTKSSTTILLPQLLRLNDNMRRR